MECDQALLEQQLEHEQRLAARYQFYVSIVLVAPKVDGISVRQILSETLRACDDVFIVEDGIGILMPHTNLQDAMKAVERYKDFCTDRIDLRFSVATYPTDDAALGLLQRAQTRLEAAKNGDLGTVVATG